MSEKSQRELQPWNVWKFATFSISIAIGCFLFIFSESNYQESSKQRVSSPISSSSSPPRLLSRPHDSSYTVGNPICKLLFPPSVQFLQHHKTGTVLNREIYQSITYFCKIRDENARRSSYWNQLRWLNFRDSQESLTALQYEHGDGIYLHFWRDPVLTIISAFFYHLESQEIWTSMPFKVELFQNAASFFDHSTDPQRVYEIYKAATWTFDVDSEPPIWRFRLNDRQTKALTMWIHERDRYRKKGSLIPFKFDRYSRRNPRFQIIRFLYLYYLHDVINGHIDLKEYGDFYGFDLNFDDTEIHRKFNIFRGSDSEKKEKFDEIVSMNDWYRNLSESKETLKYGLFYAMTQYLFAVIPEIYDFHFNLVTDPRNELKMEVWMSDFDRNLNVILDRLNLIDSAGNRAILGRNGVFDVNITEERERLYELLKKQDASTMKASGGKGKHANQRGKGRLHRRRNLQIHSNHIHKGRNNTEYIDMLLTLDAQICLVLKHITNLIEYGWSYSEYC